MAVRENQSQKFQPRPATDSLSQVNQTGRGSLIFKGDTMKLYKFAKPMNADEAAERFTIIEHRGERVIVTESHSEGWAIVPTFCYLLSDLIEA